MTERSTDRALAGQLGAGLDFQLNRWLMAGAGVRYDLRQDFDALLGGRRRPRGFEAGISVSWLFGKGAPPKP